MVKTALGGRGLWTHILLGEAPKGNDGKETTPADESKWLQEDLMVLSIIQSSLDAPILEAYSHCETAKDLWETLQKVYGNTSNLSRIFEIKKALNNLKQNGLEFTQHLGKYRSLSAELEMLRPSSADPSILNERREQDTVFGLFITLDPIFNDLIKHILRAEKLPTFDEVCSQVQREQGSIGFFGDKGELHTANKGYYKHEGRKPLACDHCKGRGHTKEKCWILHPHLRPAELRPNPRFRDFNHTSREHPRANLSNATAAGPCITSEVARVAPGPAQDDVVRKSDLEALYKSIESLKASGTTFFSHQSNNSLVVDSGASHHMISNPNLLENIEPAVGSVVIANGDQIPVKGVGDLRLFDKDSRALYMPNFTSNLLSVKRATTDLNACAIFSPNEVCFQDIETRKILGKGRTKDDLYLLEDIKNLPSFSNASSSALSSFVIAKENNVLWHARLGHPHARALKLMFPSSSYQNNECEACILGKHCKTVFPKSMTIYENCFDLIHSDVWTAPCVSRDNQKYFVTFIDEKSKYTWVTLMPSKDRVLDAFMNFQNYVTNHYNAKIKILRSDNGGEYTSNIFTQHLNKHGILHQTSCPYTPQQNGVAERKNRHLMEVARSMMFHTNVPKKFWGDALVSACYLINRIPTQILQDLSPFQVLNKTKPTYDHLRVFGCVCFVLVPGELRTKLDAKSTKAMFIGYSPTQKGYKCYVPDTGRVLVSRDVKFIESKGLYEERNWEDIKDLSQAQSDRAMHLQRLLETLGVIISPQSNPSAQPSPTEPTIAPVIEEELPGDGSDDIPLEEGNIHLDHEGGNEDQEDPDQEDVHSNSSDEESGETSVQPLRRSQRLHNQIPQLLRRSQRLHGQRVYYNANAVAHPVQAVCSLAHVPAAHQAFITQIDQEDVPKTYEEAKGTKVWDDAVAAERNAMEINHTWDEADLPEGKKTVSSRWIFTIKYKSNGEIERYKARLVARGFTQTYGEDYRDTFAPVAKTHTIRVVLSLATNLEWDLWQMDVKNAFLQGELEDEVYMTPPPGLEDTVAPGKVLRLRKAIYGLKQSPRAWYHKLSVTLRDRGFTRSESDHTLFTLQGNEGIVVILVYVDDIIISGNDKVGVKATKDYLKSVFDIKDLGELKYFLGIEVCRSKEGLFLSQRKYVTDMSSCAGKLDAKAAKTPLEEDYKVEHKGESANEPFEDAKLYRMMVGKLIYLTITRPDICFAVNQVSQHMQDPKVHHWNMVDRILRYLKGTFDQGIWMGCNGNTEIVGYCDADWAGDRTDRRSTTGYCTFIGGNLATWKTKKQKVVSCSSAEAEYRAMRKLTTELIWLKALLKDLGIEQQGPMTMHCDNQAAIHIASNSVFHERTKHIEIDCHKVRQAVEQEIILPCYTRSADQLADIFTKAASLKVIEHIHSKLGLIGLP